MITGNKGEWSEVYTVLKLLADGRLYAADANLNKIPSVYYPLIKILRMESIYGNDVKLEYGYSSNTIVNIVDEQQRPLLEIPIEEFKEQSLRLLQDIIVGKGRSFTVNEEIVEFLNGIKITRMSETSDKKRDITIVVHDIFTGFEPTLGFSIKSKLGKAATLLNASGATNFIYKVSGEALTTEQLKYVNDISGIKDRIQCLRNSERELSFHKVQNQTFCSNLQIIDSSFPSIVAAVLLYYYSGEVGASLIDLIERLKVDNPCNYNDAEGHPFYEYKIKTFLIDVALGLKPTDVWHGKYDANGGYIVVKNDGELVCYHIYNRDEFQEYLLGNTKLEQGDRGKHKFGEVYTVNGASYIKLNFQIRFK